MSRKTAWIRLLLFGCVVAVLLPLAARAAPSGRQCSPPECYPSEDTPVPPDHPPANPPDNSGGWSGYSDGRLNPAMDEYYSVWCGNDLIEVWGGVPSPQLLNTIPINDVIALGDVGSFDAGHGLTLSRSGDTIVISGGGGNGGGSGSKWFSLAACIDANGGAPPPPPLPPQNNPPASNPPPLPTPTQDGAEAAANDVSLCLPGNQSLSDFLDCLRFFAPDNPSDSYNYTIFGALWSYCLGGLAPGLPFALVISAPLLRRWRKRRR